MPLSLRANSTLSVKALAQFPYNTTSSLFWFSIGSELLLKFLLMGLICFVELIMQCFKVSQMYFLSKGVLETNPWTRSWRYDRMLKLNHWNSRRDKMSVWRASAQFKCSIIPWNVDSSNVPAQKNPLSHPPASPVWRLSGL